MQRLQFSVSWLQTTEMSFTSVLETPPNDILHPPPSFQAPLLLIFGKASSLPPTIIPNPRLFSTL